MEFIRHDRTPERITEIKRSYEEYIDPLHRRNSIDLSNKRIKHISHEISRDTQSSTHIFQSLLGLDLDDCKNTIIRGPKVLGRGANVESSHRAGELSNLAHTGGVEREKSSQGTSISSNSHRRKLGILYSGLSLLDCRNQWHHNPMGSGVQGTFSHTLSIC